MNRTISAVLTVAALSGSSPAQDFYIGGPTPGGQEPLYSYDDLEPWKHGWIQVIPFYGGYHSYRPYNYKHVYAQAAQAEAWGMPRTMPYSQQYYHRYEQLNGEAFPDHPHRSLEAGPMSSYRVPASGGSGHEGSAINTGYDPRHGAAFPSTVDPAAFYETSDLPTIAPQPRPGIPSSAQLQAGTKGEDRSAPTYEPLFLPGAPGE